MSANRRDLSRW